MTMQTMKQENEVVKFLFSHEVHVGNLSTTIRMRIYRKSNGNLLIEQSHFMKSGIQYLPYAVNEFPGLDERATVSELEKNILNFYEQAVRRGYPPSESWLVPNSSFQEV